MKRKTGSFIIPTGNFKRWIRSSKTINWSEVTVQRACLRSSIFLPPTLHTAFSQQLGPEQREIQTSNSTPLPHPSSLLHPFLLPPPSRWSQKTTTLQDNGHVLGMITGSLPHPLSAKKKCRGTSWQAWMKGEHLQSGSHGIGSGETSQAQRPITAFTYTQCLLWRETQRWEHLLAPIWPRKKEKGCGKARFCVCVCVEWGERERHVPFLNSANGPSSHTAISDAACALLEPRSLDLPLDSQSSYISYCIRSFIQDNCLRDGLCGFTHMH